MKIIIKSDGKRKSHFAGIVKALSLAQEYGKFIDFAMKAYMATANSRRRICWGYSFFKKLPRFLKNEKEMIAFQRYLSL